MEVVTKYWQFATVFGAIVAAVGAGLSYFATRDELTRLDCSVNWNLLVNTLPDRIDLLQTKIALAQQDLRSRPLDSADADNDRNQIDELKAKKSKASDDLDKANRNLQLRTCNRPAQEEEK